MLSHSQHRRSKRRQPPEGKAEGPHSLRARANIRDPQGAHSVCTTFSRNRNRKGFSAYWNSFCDQELILSWRKPHVHIKECECVPWLFSTVFYKCHLGQVGSSRSLNLPSPYYLLSTKCPRLQPPLGICLFLPAQHPGFLYTPRSTVTACRITCLLN